MYTELSPKHIQYVSFENLTPQNFLVLIMEAAKKLNWNIGPVSEYGFIAYKKQTGNYSNEELNVGIGTEIAILASRYTGIQTVNEFQNKQNIDSLLVSFIELKNSYNSQELSWRYDQLKPNLVSRRISHLVQPPSTREEDLAGVIGIFKPSPGYHITPIIIDLNIIIFLVMVMSGVHISSPDIASMIKWGANLRLLTMKGEWWRLLSSCFLHAGVLHLFFNMYALLYIGLLLEPHLGKKRFAIAYLLTGIAASITSLWWHNNAVSVGASGAIFGMYGVFLAMLTTNLLQNSTRNALLMSIAVFVGYSLIGGMQHGIDNAAHLGGLISGIVIGYAYVPGLKNSVRNI
ncbi:MAG: rhomboid family intramembrane serine protease [Chitinophagaceae bacterium]